MRGAVTAMCALALVAAACGGEDGAGGAAAEEDRRLTVYSGREEELVGDLLASFEHDTGVELDVRYGDSAELAATILEEGEASPADVFFAQDAGALGAVAAEGVFAELDDAVLERVDDRFVSPEGLWVGTSGRARVVAYNTERLSESDLPESIEGFTDPRWKGRIGFPPTNASFQAFVAAMIALEGEEETRRFLEGLEANAPRFYDKNSTTVRGVAAGEVDVGLVNHYYLYEVAAEEGDIPVANHFMDGGDPGALVNAAGVGMLASTDAKREAELFVDYLTGDEGQRYFAEETFEYPVVPGHEPRAELVPLDEIESPDIDLSDLADTIDPALKLLADVGLL